MWHRRLTLLVGVMLWSAAPHMFAAEPDVTVPLRAGQLMLQMPKPAYPAEAVAKRITGSGKYEVAFHLETGAVTRVRVLESTGSKPLDEGAAKALLYWRARPGRISRMRLRLRSPSEAEQVVT